MAGNRLLTPALLASFVAFLGLVGASIAASSAWAAGHERRPMRTMPPGQQMERRPPATGTQVAPTVLTRPTPRTLDEYAAFVQDSLQVQAMNVQQQGTAELKLTIRKDGAVRDIEIVRVEGPRALREQLPTLVDQAAPFPPLPEDADVLVLTTTLAFNYPSRGLYDQFRAMPQRGMRPAAR